MQIQKKNVVLEKRMGEREELRKDVRKDVRKAFLQSRRGIKAISKIYGVHPVQVYMWIKDLL